MWWFSPQHITTTLPCPHQPQPHSWNGSLHEPTSSSTIFVHEQQASLRSNVICVLKQAKFGSPLKNINFAALLHATQSQTALRDLCFNSRSLHHARPSPLTTALPPQSEHCLDLWIHFLFIAQMNDLRAIKREECNPCVESWGFPWQPEKDSRECSCILWICKERPGLIPGEI